MFRLIGLFLVVAIGAAAYFLTTEDSMFSPQKQPEVSNTPAAEQPITPTLTPATPLVVEKVVQPVMTEAEKQQAQAHVDSITAQAAKPLEITTANHFVTADQILQLPALQAPEVAEIISTDNNTALIVSAPAKDTAKLNDIEKNAENAAAAQSFAVKIPSFKKPVTQSEPEKKVITTIKDKVEPATIITVKAAADKIVADNKVIVDHKTAVNDEAVAENKSVVNDKTVPEKKIADKVALVEKVSDVTTAVVTKTLTTDNTASLNTTEAVKTTEKENIKVLGTVTGTIEPVKKISIVTVTPVTVEVNSPESETSIMSVLKENIEQLSDIKVSELTKLVAEKINTVAKPVLQVIVKADPPAVSKAPESVAVINLKDTSTTEPATAIDVEQKQATTTTITATATEIIKEQEKITLSDKNRIKLRELLSETQTDKKRIFYLHAVNVKDDQGIWGIIQQGLMGTFSKGIKLTQANGEVRALIPQDADEILISKQSSFLGKLLNYKVLTTYVYNFEQGNIGKNPDIIKPGQQLIIVTFTEDELMSVYQHFKNKQ